MSWDRCRESSNLGRRGELYGNKQWELFLVCALKPSLILQASFEPWLSSHAPDDTHDLLYTADFSTAKWESGMMIVKEI